MRHIVLGTIYVCCCLMTPLGLAAGHAANAEPPTTVGEIAELQGKAMLFSPHVGEWALAVQNYPIIPGDTIYAAPNSRVGIAITSSEIMLSSDTELRIASIASDYVGSTLLQGEAFFSVRGLVPGDQYEISTQRGTVIITHDGQYDVIAGNIGTPTEVTVLTGVAIFHARDSSITIYKGQTAYLEGSNSVTATVGAERLSPFTREMLSTKYVEAPDFVPPVVAQMTGSDQLLDYGSWSQLPDYGAIWYPRVGPAWAPYHDGYWAYIEPWGWTWIDNDPWGFAPFHYGRWLHHGGRWGWVPIYGAVGATQYYRPPVYAPALVSFFSVSPATAISVGITIDTVSSGVIGWVPLAPGEPYLPWYRCPPNYIRQINSYAVRNVSQFVSLDNVLRDPTVVNIYKPMHLRNRQAAMVVPATEMRQGRPVARYGRSLPETFLASASTIPPSGVRGFVAASVRQPSSPSAGLPRPKQEPPPLRQLPSAPSQPIPPPMQQYRQQPQPARPPMQQYRQQPQPARPPVQQYRTPPNRQSSPKENNITSQQAS